MKNTLSHTHTHTPIWRARVECAAVCVVVRTPTYTHTNTKVACPFNTQNRQRFHRVARTKVLVRVEQKKRNMTARDRKSLSRCTEWQLIADPSLGNCNTLHHTATQSPIRCTERHRVAIRSLCRALLQQKSPVHVIRALQKSRPLLVNHFIFAKEPSTCSVDRALLQKSPIHVIRAFQKSRLSLVLYFSLAKELSTSLT